MGLVGRWLSDAVRLVLALGLALGAVQVPAIANGYAAALLQIAQDARRDIEQRKNVARQYYALTDTGDASVIAALRQREPANAESLSVSIQHAAEMRQAYEEILAASPLLRPVVALANAVVGVEPDRMTVLRIAVASHVPQIELSSTGATYGLIGLLAGSLLAQVLLGMWRGVTGIGRKPKPVGW